MPPFEAESPVELPLLVVFADLTRYSAESLRVPDLELARTMDAYYERVAARVAPAGGRVVKFIGDAALVVFPESDLDAGLRAMLALKAEVDAWFASLGWECRLVVKAHFGPVAAGPYGAVGDKRFDVLGQNVNRAAMLQSTGVTVSAEAFARLGAELRGQFEQDPGALTHQRRGDPPRRVRER